jgi:hypothetical protein
MATTVILKDELSRRALLAGCWQHLLTEGDIPGGDDLYSFAFDACRPEATDAQAREARDKFDRYLEWLSSTRADVRRVEMAELDAAVEFETITTAELAESLASYRKWIEDTREGFWERGPEHRQEMLDRHDAVGALLDGLPEPVVA